MFSNIFLDKELRKFLVKKLPSEIVPAAYFVLSGNHFTKTIIPPLSHERILHEVRIFVLEFSNVMFVVAPIESG